MRIDLSCAECGKNRFSLTEAQNDACMIRCEDCGHEVGTLGELKRHFAAAVTRQSAIPQHPELGQRSSLAERLRPRVL
jgi:uncharacterized Zn finger protein